MTARMIVVLMVCIGLLVPAEAAVATERYTPTGGVTFNSPLGDSATRNRIFNKITRSIYAAPKGSTIRIFTWNFLTRAGVEALLKAQDRGVRVRLLMSETNTTQIENQPFARLHRELKAGNRHRKAERHSWARVCSKSCRGQRGTAHAKYYLFSKSGKARQVLIQGSANYTVASGSNQWNDVVTSVGRRKLYDYAKDVFQQAARDTPVHPPFIGENFGSTRLMFFPDTGGKNVTDPVMDLLDEVRCHNAENTPNGRTVLRLAPDVIREERGMVIGRKLRSLWEHGCDIHIGYTVMGVAVGRMLRSHSGRGPVPLKHLVQDVDGDGEFDNYFHLKAMSIVGHLRKNRRAYAVLNGSANMSGNSKVSDENVAIYRRKQITMKYQGHINYWFDNFPQPESSTTTSRLMFGDGANYVLEGESPGASRAARSGINPFAHVDMD